MSDYEHLRFERDGHVTVLTYDRPEQRNAISRAMNAELHDAWRRFRDDDEQYVLVITGAGSAFCAGWDLADAAAWEQPEWDDFRRHLHTDAGVCGYSRRFDVFKPRSTAGPSPRASRTRCSPTSASSRRTRSSARWSAAGTSSPATG